MANNKHRWNKAEEFYLKNNWNSKSIEEMASDLALAPETVQGKIDRMKESMLPTAMDNMILESDGRKHKVAIMTPTASQLGDEARKQTKATSPRVKDCIHVINKNRPKAL